MATTYTRSGLRFMNKVGPFVYKDNKSGKIAFEGEYATSYAIEITDNTNDTRGGATNQLLLQNHTDKTLSATLTIKDWKLEYVAATQNSLISHGLSEMFKIAQVTETDAVGKATLNPAPVGLVYVTLPSGLGFHVKASAANEIDLSAHQEALDACVKVTYAYKTNVKTVVIGAEGNSMIGTLILQGRITDSRYGEVGMVQAEIPAFALASAFTLNFNGDGTTSETVVSGVALAVDGTECKDGGVYGYIKEEIYDSTAEKIVEIIARPNPVEITGTGTQMLDVSGSYGFLHTPVPLLNTDCTFAAAPATVCTVSPAGLVTGVAPGSATITVAHNGMTEIVEVTVY